jgi:hypothetical protein
VGRSSKQAKKKSHGNLKEGRGKNRHTNQGPRTCAVHAQRSRPRIRRSLRRRRNLTALQADPRGPRGLLVDARVAAFRRVHLPGDGATATATAPRGGSDGSGPVAPSGEMNRWTVTGAGRRRAADGPPRPPSRRGAAATCAAPAPALALRGVV